METRPTAPNGYRSPDLAKKPAALILDHSRVEGVLYMDPSKARFSDAWDTLLHEQRSFIPVTDAIISSHDSRRTQAVDFLLVDKADVKAACSLEEDEEASSPARRTPLDPVAAVLMLDSLRVSGTVHVESGKARFSDAWESLLRDRRPFVIVTDATITGSDDRRLLVAMPILLLDKEEIQAAFPVAADEVTGSAARRIDRQPVRASLLLDGMRVEGTVHVEPGIPRFSRFSDTWEALVRDRRTFIPITDVTMWSGDGGTQLAAAPFMVVEKADIRAAFPV